MKPFDLELAKQGNPVCNRERKDVRIICFDRKAHADNLYSIIALHPRKDGSEDIYVHADDGKINTTGNSPYDLFMKTRKMKGWVNVYGFVGTGNRVLSAIYGSEEEAKENVDGNAVYITTTCIEWEE